MDGGTIRPAFGSLPCSRRFLSSRVAWTLGGGRVLSVGRDELFTLMSETLPANRFDVGGWMI